MGGGAGFPARVPNPAQEAPTPERCLETYHRQRTHLELTAEPKGSRNVGITGRDPDRYH
jgi:hypothetical protein